MAGVVAGLLVAVACMGCALLLGVIDEVRRPPAALRRAGSGLAMVAAFAALYLLLRPFALDAATCPAPLLVLASADIGADGACASAMRTWTGIGLGLAVLAPILVLATRNRGF